MAERKVIIRAEADTSGAEAGLGRISTSGVALGTALGSLAASGVRSLIEGFGSLVRAGADWVAASAEQEQAGAQLDASLRNAGTYTPQLAQSYRDLATEFQRTANVGDEELLPLMAQLTSVGGVQASQMRQTTQAALDLAAGLGTDVASAVGLLSKAAEGNTTALGRVGLTIQKTGDSAKDFAAVLALVEERFGGMAAASAETFAGRLEQIGIVSGEIQESLGDVVREGLTPFLGVVSESAVQLQAFVEAHKTDLILDFIGALQMAIDVALLGVQAVGSLRETYSGLKVTFAEVMAALAPFIEMMGKAVAAQLSAAATIADFTGFDDMAGNLRDAASAIREAGADISAGAQANVEDQEASAAATRKSVDAINEQATALRDRLAGALDEARAKAEGHTGAVEDNTLALGANTEGLGANTRAAREAAEAEAKLLHSLGLITESDAATRMATLNDQMRVLRENGIYTGEAYEKVAQSARKLKEEMQASGITGTLALEAIAIKADAAAGAIERTGNQGKKAGQDTREGMQGATEATEKTGTAAAQAAADFQVFHGKGREAAQGQVVVLGEVEAAAARAGVAAMTAAVETENAARSAMVLSRTIGGGGGPSAQGSPGAEGARRTLEAIQRGAGPMSNAGRMAGEAQAMLARGDIEGAKEIAAALRNNAAVMDKFGGLMGSGDMKGQAFALTQAIGQFEEGQRIPTEYLRRINEGIAMLPQGQRAQANRMLRDLGPNPSIQDLPPEVQSQVASLMSGNMAALSSLKGMFEQMMAQQRGWQDSVNALASRPVQVNVNGAAIATASQQGIERNTTRRR